MAKPVGRPRKKKPGHPSPIFTEKQINDMFDWWMAHDQNYNGTAKHFEASRTTLRRMAKRQGWDARAAKIQGQIRNAIDRKIVKREVSQIDILTACLKRELAAYQNREPEGKVEVILKIVELLAKIEGNLDAPNASDSVLDLLRDHIGKLSESERATIRGAASQALAMQQSVS